MERASPGDVYSVIWLVRRLYQRMANENEAMHSTAGLTASEWGILELLAYKEPLTVPQLAREKSVSRQNVQVIINELRAAGLVETRNNPAHKRSPMIQRSTAGRQVCDHIRAREIAVITDMVARFDTRDLRTTARALQAMMDYFDTHTWASRPGTDASPGD